MSAIGKVDANILTRILDFAGDANDAEVCSSFRNATRASMDQLCSQLAMTHNSLVERVRSVAIERYGNERPIHEIFVEQLNAVLEKFRRVLLLPEAVPPPNEEFRQSTYGLAIFSYERLAGLRDSCLAEQNGAVRETRMCSLLEEIPRLNLKLDEIESENEPDERRFCFLVFCCGYLNDENHKPGFKRFLVQQNLTARFRKIQEAMPQASSVQRLASLYSSQRQIRELYRDVALERWNNLRVRDSVYTMYLGERHFSKEKFLEAEAPALYAELEDDKALKRFWPAIEAELDIQQVNLGANPPRTGPQIREWMNAAQSAPLLDRIESIHFQRLGHLPREIDRLRNLRRLTCTGGDSADERLRKLPNQFANLNHLTSLSLDRQDFEAAQFARELPQVVCRLTQLENLSLSELDLRRASLPQAIENLVNLRTLSIHSCRLETVPRAISLLPRLQHLDLGFNAISRIPLFLGNQRSLREILIFGNPIEVLPDEVFRPLDNIWQQDRWPIWIDRERLRQIPFRLFWRDAVRLPPPPVFGPRHFENTPFDGILSIPLCVLCNIPFALLILPVFLWNFVMMEIVEPIITFFRDLFGYSRLVDGDPLPSR